jgi:hypothetical protein
MIGINRETVRKILFEDLKKKKVCTRFVPHMLTPDQKHQCTASSVEILVMTDDRRTVTGNESWCMYDPETKCQSET